MGGYWVVGEGREMQNMAEYGRERCEGGQWAVVAGMRMQGMVGKVVEVWEGSGSVWEGRECREW